MKLVHYFPFIIFLFLLTGCSEERDSTDPVPLVQATGDEQAIEWAKRVVEASGGNDAWLNTRYIHWNFFDMRELLWDKWENKVRIKSSSPQIEAILDLESKKGPIESELKSRLGARELRQKVYEMWINDSYWLAMPFKLLDPGVHLSYLGKDSTGRFEQIEVTFDSVGITPQNRYIVSINPQTHRIARWSYYTNTGDERPRFTMRWGGYQKYGGIWLASERGRNRSLSNIWVAQSIDQKVMQDLDVPIPDR